MYMLLALLWSFWIFFTPWARVCVFVCLCVVLPIHVCCVRKQKKRWMTLRRAHSPPRSTVLGYRNQAAQRSTRARRRTDDDVDDDQPQVMRSRALVLRSSSLKVYDILYSIYEDGDYLVLVGPITSSHPSLALSHAARALSLVLGHCESVLPLYERNNTIQELLNGKSAQSWPTKQVLVLPIFALFRWFRTKLLGSSF